MMVFVEEHNWRVTARCNVCGGEFNVFSDDVVLIKREIAAFIRKHERINHDHNSNITRKNTGNA